MNCLSEIAKNISILNLSARRPMMLELRYLLEILTPTNNAKKVETGKSPRSGGAVVMFT